MSDMPVVKGGLVGASLALGPIPEVGFVLQFTALFGAFGAVAAARIFRRKGDADERWLITTRWATFGLMSGIGLVLLHLAIGVP